MEGINVREIAYLRLFHERLPHKTPQHLKLFEFMFRSGLHHSVGEVAAETGIYTKFASLILNELAENKIIEKQGCLYRCNGLALEEIVKFE